MLVPMMPMVPTMPMIPTCLYAWDAYVPVLPTMLMSLQWGLTTKSYLDLFVQWAF